MKYSLGSFAPWYIFQNQHKTLNNLYLLRIMSISFASLKHLNLPIIIKIPVTIWKIAYIYMTAIPPNLISWTMCLLSWYLCGCKGNYMYITKDWPYKDYCWEMTNVRSSKLFGYNLVRWEAWRLMSSLGNNVLCLQYVLGHSGHSKTCVKRPLKNRQNKDLNGKW